jgi:uncharacterized membrane protein YcaP (DUF421 family)
MDKITGMDWHGTFAPDTPLLEIFIRGTLVYLLIFVMLRVIPKRQLGTVGITDLLVIVLIADAAQNAMADEYNSLTDGIVLVATIICWSTALDWLGYHFAIVRRFTYPNPLLLVGNGQMQRKHLKNQMITDEELMSQLRIQGVDDLSTIKASYLEGDGRVSVIEKEQKHHEAPDQPGS